MSEQTGRDSKGRFTKGNAGGPGNPFARQTAAMRQAYLNGISEVEMMALAKVTLQKALNGDMAAARLVLLYVLGKPLESRDPDRLDLEEVELFREGALATRKMPEALSGPQADFTVACIRAAVPELKKGYGQVMKQTLQEVEREEKHAAQEAAEIAALEDAEDAAEEAAAEAARQQAEEAAQLAIQLAAAQQQEKAEKAKQNPTKSAPSTNGGEAGPMQEQPRRKETNPDKAPNRHESTKARRGPSANGGNGSGASKQNGHTPVPCGT